MKKKNFLFAALTLAALSVGLVSCDDAQDLKDQQKFNVTVVSLDDAMGTVTGSGQYPVGSEIVITATANEGYSFQKWHDGNTDNPRIITVTADITYTAIFAASYDPGQYFYVTVVSSNEVMGTVKGEGNYPAGAKINIMATPNLGFVFQKWDDGNTDTTRTITVTGDATYTAIFDYCISGTANGHDYVDLGLPSGTKWATCNVGATKPEEYGNYYQWGEIEPGNNDYYWADYQWAIGRQEGWDNIFEALTKYNTDANYGTVDNKTELELADDAARANWGGTWRMPTDDEWTELRENCEWTWAVGCYQDKNGNGKNGYIVKGPNGNFIFLPAAGYGWEYNRLYAGDEGYYWSNLLNSDDPRQAWGVHFSSDDVGRYGGGYRYRCWGLSVRPVCK